MVTLADARKVIAAAEKKAREIECPSNIAVVDEGGNLVSHVRMDGGWIGSIDVSINKAFTSRHLIYRRRNWRQIPNPAVGFLESMCRITAAS